MRYAILGGDRRFAHLAQLLRENGRFAAAFLQEKAGGEARPLETLGKFDCIISNWPMKWPLSETEPNEEEILSQIAPGSMLLLCGPKFPAKKRWDLQYINLWKDEILLQENAWLTAEAAVASVLRSDLKSLTGVNALVIGCGRIGRALMEILLNLGANVTVMSGSQDKRSRAEESGAKAVSMKELIHALPAQKLIFSTPPSMILDERMLRSAAKDALVIDLASPPYGVDLNAAQKLQLNVRREPGLPGRYCPQSAARVLYNAVIRWEEGECDET